MKKTKVLIASVLKPIDDARMYEKFGLSLEQTNKYDINIIGFASKNVPTEKGIEFHPLSPFPRMSFDRLMAPWKVWKVLLKVKPKILIVNTHELLIVSSLYKIFFGCKIVYDIRENYLANILYTDVYPGIWKRPLATWVRMKEWLTKPFINKQIIAERAYRDELPFLRKDAVLLENKYKNLPEQSLAKNPQTETIDLLYSGTIATTYGIFEAIQLAKNLHALNASVRLVIIGYCAKKGDLLHLQEEIQDEDFIQLLGGDHLVPHQEIVDEIRKADFGLIMNHPNKSTDKKLPTRLFEYTACQLPIISINNRHWSEFLKPFNAGISINPQNVDYPALLTELQTRSFYGKGDTNSSFWNTEEPKLLSLISDLH